LAGYGLKVFGVAAGSVPAKVIQLESFRDGPDECLVRESVSLDRTVGYLDHAISRGVESVRPSPTTVRFDNVLLVEPF
jgi:hypothetical protein